MLIVKCSIIEDISPSRLLSCYTVGRHSAVRASSLMVSVGESALGYTDLHVNSAGVKVHGRYCREVLMKTTRHQRVLGLLLVCKV